MMTKECDHYYVDQDSPICLKILMLFYVILSLVVCGGNIFGFTPLKEIFLDEGLYYDEYCTSTSTSTSSSNNTTITSSNHLIPSSPSLDNDINHYDNNEAHDDEEEENDNDKSTTTSASDGTTTTATTKICQKQLIQLDRMFTLAGSLFSVWLLPSGFCLRILGPKICYSMGFVLVWFGSILFALPVHDKSTTGGRDYYTLAYVLMGTGNPLLYISAFNFSRILDGKQQTSNLLLSIFIGCFGFSSSVFYVFNVLHYHYGYSSQELFELYSIFPILLCVIGLLIIPSQPYHIQYDEKINKEKLLQQQQQQHTEAAEEVSSDGTTTSRKQGEETGGAAGALVVATTTLNETTPLLLLNKNMNNNEVVKSSKDSNSSSNSNKTEESKTNASGETTIMITNTIETQPQQPSSSSKEEEDEEVEIVEQQQQVATQIPLKERTIPQQLVSGPFIGQTLFFCWGMLHQNFYMGTLGDQIFLFAGDDIISQETATNILIQFSVLYPLGCILSIIPVGILVRNTSVSTSLFAYCIANLLFATLSLIPNVDVQWITSTIYIVVRVGFFTVMSTYSSNIFGFRNLSSMFGSAGALAGLCSLGGAILNHRALYIDHSFIPINTVLLVGAVINFILPILVQRYDWEVL